MKLNKNKLIHIVGVGGIGMSGIAEILSEMGYQVQGSDIKINANIVRLNKKKIKTFKLKISYNNGIYNKAKRKSHYLFC